jgi:hypothetical protein
MKVRFIVSTNKVGSECQGDYDFDESDFEGCETEEDRDAVIDAALREFVVENTEASWEVVSKR